jgi:uracil-DNA glycosylase
MSWPRRDVTQVIVPGGGDGTARTCDDAWMLEQSRMNKDPEFLAGKRRRVHDPHVRPLNALVDRWNGEGLPVPYADPDSGGINARILFLHESPGPRASAEHGSGLVSPDNNDPSADRFWRLSREAALARDSHINWNAVPWYVSGTAKNQNATTADGQAALPYLHEFVTLLPDLRVVVVMGVFAQRWWFRYLIDCPDSRVLPVLAAPHTSSRARISNPRFEQDIFAAMAKARQAAR